MADYTLPNHLGRQLDELAQRLNRSRDELLQEWLDEQQAKADQEETLRLSIVRKLYPLAREYWRRVGDQKRLALTDEQLDQQFWLIDHEGIPRLKEDEGMFELPRDPLDDLIGIIKYADSTLSTSVHEAVEEYLRSRNAESGDEETTH